MGLGLGSLPSTRPPQSRPGLHSHSPTYPPNPNPHPDADPKLVLNPNPDRPNPCQPEPEPELNLTQVDAPPARPRLILTRRSIPVATTAAATATAPPADPAADSAVTPAPASVTHPAVAPTTRSTPSTPSTPSAPCSMPRASVPAAEGGVSAEGGVKAAEGVLEGSRPAAVPLARSAGAYVPPARRAAMQREMDG